VTKHEHERSIITPEYLQNPPLLWFGVAAPIMLSSDSLLAATFLCLLLSGYAVSMFQMEQKVNGFARVV
jgi:hypothetical protein